MKILSKVILLSAAGMLAATAMEAPKNPRQTLKDKMEQLRAAREKTKESQINPDTARGQIEAAKDQENKAMDLISTGIDESTQSEGLIQQIDGIIMAILEDLKKFEGLATDSENAADAIHQQFEQLRIIFEQTGEISEAKKASIAELEDMLNALQEGDAARKDDIKRITEIMEQLKS